MCSCQLPHNKVQAEQARGGDTTWLGHSPKVVLVAVAYLLEYGCSRLRGRGLAVGSGVEAKIVLYNICHGLRIGGRT